MEVGFRASTPAVAYTFMPHRRERQISNGLQIMLLKLACNAA